jgi:hypothetical protein
MVNLQTVVRRRKEGLLVSELGKEVVMMDIDNGNYIGLNETGKVIWDMIEEPMKVGDLIEQLTQKYDIAKDECSADTLECLNKMEEQKLIATD